VVLVTTLDIHSLDTNIILGFTIDWQDKSQPLNTYISNVESDVSLVASERVFQEAKNVVRKQRQLAKLAGRVVFQEMGRNNPYASTQDIIDTVWAKFANRDDVQKNTLSAVCGYIEHIENETGPLFSNLARTNANPELTRLKDQVDDDFDDMEKLIQSIQDQNHSELTVVEFNDTCAISTYASRYASEYTNLNDLMENKMDRDILMDCYHYYKENGCDTVLFVSLDTKDIVCEDKDPNSGLSVRERIEEILNGIFVRKPDEL
jgi:hypothetical protein